MRNALAVMRGILYTVLLVAVHPAQAWACPACAGQSDDGSRLWVLGLMSAPFLVAGAVALAIHRTRRAP